MDFAGSKRQLNHGDQMAVSRTAILWGGENLLSKALESLMTAVSGWKVIKVLDDHDVRTLVREVEKINPEVVFISLENSDAGPSMPIPPTQGDPELKVITINPENNRIEVFSRQVFWIKDMSDLLSVIDDHSHPASEGGNKP